jgi:hypothetical protein
MSQRLCEGRVALVTGASKGGTGSVVGRGWPDAYSFGRSHSPRP